MKRHYKLKLNCVNVSFIMPSDTSLCNLKLFTFAQCLVPEEKQLYCQKLKELGCVDPLLIPLGVYKSGKNMIKCFLL